MAVRGLRCLGDLHQPGEALTVGGDLARRDLGLDDAPRLGRRGGGLLRRNGSCEGGAVGTGVRIWKRDNGLPATGSAVWTNAPFLSSPVGVSGLRFDRSGRHVYFQDRLVLEGQQEVLGISRLLLEPPSTERQIVATNIQNNYAQPICILPRRGELAYTTRRRELIVLDLDSGRPVRRIPTVPDGPRDTWFIANLRASPDETRFALVTTSGLGVEIRDVATGRLLYTLPESRGSIWWVAWAPDSRRLAVTRSNGEIAVWDLAEVERRMIRHWQSDTRQSGDGVLWWEES